VFTLFKTLSYNLTLISSLFADGIHFYEISDDVYRFYPIRVQPESMTRLHGIDEKISKDNYKEIIEFSYHLIKKFN